MNARILQFKPKTSEEAITRLCTRIFHIWAQVQVCPVEKLIGDFRAENPELVLADLLAACALCKTLIGAFQLFVVALDREDDGDAG